MQMLVWRDEQFHLEQGIARALRHNEVRIAVNAIGVNRADILQRRGLYPPPVGVRSDVLGLECSGVITEVSNSYGKRSSEWIGNKVMVLLPGEAYASEVIVDIGCVLPIPDHLSMSEAAAIPEAFITAYDALWVQSGLRSGQCVCIHAVGSGVGDAARQLCLAKGYEVYGTTRSLEKAQRLATAESPVFYIPDGIFAPEMPSVDVIVDFVGAAYLKQNLQLLNPMGHLQLVGLLGGIKTDINLATVLNKRLTIRGTTLRNRSILEKSALIRQFIQDAMPLFTQRTISPTIDSVYSWKEAGLAHQRMIDNKNIGKIVLKVD